MSAKEWIVSQLNVLDENDLNELYAMIRQFMEKKQHAELPSLMTRLKRVQIDAPPDYAANLDAYTSGEKRVE